MKPLFLGTGTALVTPFRNDEVDWEAFELLIEEQIAGGVTALIAAGTTGEPSTMTWEEQLKVIRFVCDKAAGRACVIAGTGSNCTREAIEAAKAVKDFGAQAQLCEAMGGTGPSITCQKPRSLRCDTSTAICEACMRRTISCPKGFSPSLEPASAG